MDRRNQLPEETKNLIVALCEHSSLIQKELTITLKLSNKQSRQHGVHVCGKKIMRDLWHQCLDESHL